MGLVRARCARRGPAGGVAHRLTRAGLIRGQGVPSVPRPAACPSSSSSAGRAALTRARRAGRKAYARALGLLLHGLTAPTQVVNAITVAMYKKYALVSLIHAGAASPRGARTQAARRPRAAGAAQY